MIKDLHNLSNEKTQLFHPELQGCLGRDGG